MADSADIAIVRTKIGDSDGTLLSEEEVAVFVDAWPDNAEMAAAECAEAIAAKFSRDFNFSTDGQTFNRRERVGHYMDLAARLRRRGGQFVWPVSET